jgi:uncharacterized protein (DUF302 family)
MLEHTRFGTRKTVHRQFADVVESTKRALAANAFRVVSEFDCDSTRKCTVLGAWNALATKAVQREPEIGGVLPCNVVIYEESSGSCVVSAVDPFCALEVVGPDSLVEAAVIDSREKLQRAIESV